MSGQIAARLQALGVVLPSAPAPVANYVPFVVTGTLAFISGQGPMENGVPMTGLLGADMDIAAGQRATRLAFINVLAQAQAACGGDLDRVRRVVRLGGFVAAAPGFTAHAQVMNGASDLAVAVFGDMGRHARTTIGVPSLPLGFAVEVEGLFEIAP